MDYYELGEIKFNKKFEEIVTKEIKEAIKIISRIDFHLITEYEKKLSGDYLKAHQKYKPDAKSDVYWVPPNLYQADIYLPAVIRNWKQMYLFIHEIGHAVNKHAGFSLDISMREDEADIYTIQRMEEWLSIVVKKVDKDKIKNIIAVTKMRIEDRGAFINSRL